MAFPGVDIVAWLVAMGDAATVGEDSLLVDFQGPWAEMAGSAGELAVGEPHALADPNDVAALGIEAGTAITILGHDYRVAAVDPTPDGFAVLHLVAP